MKKQFEETELGTVKVTIIEPKKKTSRMPTGYGIVQKEVMKMDISIQAKAIYCLLSSYTGSKEYCFPSIKTISDDLKISEKLVYKYMKELKQTGLVIISKLYSDQRNNHKYEICYIDTPQNVNIEGVENVNVLDAQNVNVLGSQNIPINKINSINNNSIKINSNIIQKDSLPSGKGKTVYLEKIVKYDSTGCLMDEADWTELTLKEFISMYEVELISRTGIDHKCLYSEIGAFNKAMINYIKSLRPDVTSWQAVKSLVDAIEARFKEQLSKWTPDFKTINWIVKNKQKYYSDL
jgi:hypothetical protein